ncbi:hypothetical protein KKF91_15345 [Myxococcota bacterium]|nr:hypothetical protein [Myxococcota bacterium]MBU1431915.1 hypothetical protein [Myxococcota bacterium]MBU1900425.1 hypothetical protein [Myxococcota bacterium]
MPLIVKLEQLRPGAALAEPLTHNGQLLLAAHRPLNPREIDAVQARWAGGHIKIVEPTLDARVAFDDDLEMRLDLQARLEEAVGLVSPVARQLASGAPLSEAQLKALRRAVREALARWRQPQMIIIDPTAPPTPYHRAARLILFAFALGHGLREWVGEERERLTLARHSLTWRGLTDLEQLGTAAALAHADTMIGDAAEHPMGCLRCLPEKIPPILHATLSNHHEDYAGGGRPKGTPARDLHVFSRILRVADAFEQALTTAPPALALKQIIDEAGRAFDPTLTERLRALIQPLAVGSRARLCDGRVAVVVGYRPKDGLDPKLLIAYDARGRRLPEAEIEGPLHLSERADLSLHGL